MLFWELMLVKLSDEKHFRNILLLPWPNLKNKRILFFSPKSCLSEIFDVIKLQHIFQTEWFDLSSSYKVSQHDTNISQDSN